MQVNTAINTFDEYNEDDCLELTIYPPSASSATNSSNLNVPTSTSAVNTEPQTLSTTQQQQQPETQTDLLYKSLTNCSNLNPEPRPSWSMGMDDDSDNEDENDTIHHDYQTFDDADEDGGNSGITITGGADSVGGIPALAPGGWITADNVDSIQWTIGGVSGRGDPNSSTGGNGLGPGAGTVRTREEEEHGDGSGGKDEVVDDEGVVTNGAGETKWRRTD